MIFQQRIFCKLNISHLNSELNFIFSNKIAVFEEYKDISITEVEAAIKAYVDTLSNDGKLHIVKFVFSSTYIAVIQKYNTSAYASFLFFGYAYSRIIYRRKVGGTWRDSKQSGNFTCNVSAGENLVNANNLTTGTLPEDNCTSITIAWCTNSYDVSVYFKANDIYIKSDVAQTITATWFNYLGN